MTLSRDARRRNLEEALVSFMDALGDGWFSAFYINRSDFPHVPTGKKAARTESDNRRQPEQVDSFEVLRTAKPTLAKQRKEP